MSKNNPSDSLLDASSTQPAELADHRFFQSDFNTLLLKRDIRRWLSAIGWSLVLIPLIFYLEFGEVGAIGWGLSVFFSSYCLLSAVGLYFFVKPEYHTPVKSRDGWLDQVGAYWLVTCAFGPFFGWVLTTACTLTMENWHYLYGSRVILSICFPVLTAVPMLRYVRGRGAPVMLILLLGVTALPIWSGWAAFGDLRAGPVATTEEKREASSKALRRWYLPQTGRVVEGP